ncbi:hypothetical protein [Sphingobium cupriresistens]|uniref:hypothetical protein n=1 Tax=Sphingobium cupriresistens TaxID=1132417 RepID=UPI003BF52AC9
MPKIADLPELEGELTGAETIIVEDIEATKRASVAVLATRAQLLSVTPTSGNLLSRSSAAYDYANGAIPIIRSGRRVGWTLPVGSTGIGSNVVPFLPLEYDTVRRIKGATVRIRTIVKATPGYLDIIGFGGNAVQVRRRNGSTDTNVGVQIGTPYQVGEQLVRDFAYVMQGDEVAFAATMQVGAGHDPLTQELSFEVVSVSWDVIVALPLEGSPVGVDMMLDTRLGALAPSVDLFDRIEAVEDAAYIKNGAAILRDARDRAIGLSVPVGASGMDAIMQWRHVLNGRKRALLAGADLLVVLGFNTTAEWNRPHVLNMQARTIGLAPVEIVTSNLFDAQLSATRRVIAFTFAMPSGVDLDDLRPFLRLAGADAATAAESIILTDMSVQIFRTRSDVAKVAEQTGALADESARADAVRQAAATMAGTGGRIGRRLTVRAGNFASIAAALMQATLLASPGDMAAVIVPEGNYAENSLGLTGSGTDGDHIALRGAGIGRTNIIARLPTTTDQATIVKTSALDFNATQEIEGLTAIVRNGCYAIHVDAVRFEPDSRLVFRNVEGIHEGNDEADAHHATSVWLSQHAFAIGTCSGSHYLFDGCRGTAPRAAFSAHNQVDFADPSVVELANGRWTATKAGGWAVRLESIGSRVMDRCIMRGNLLSGEISLAVTPWYPTALADQPADRREWEIVGFGNSPAVFRPESWSRALRIVSATTGLASKVEISGTAELILFTRQAIERPGDVGLAGDAYSWGCIQDQVGVGPGRDIFITGLGKRLGNRTGAPVTLTVRVNGGAAINIVFNQDFTLWTNAQVLTFINTALGGAAVADEYDVEGLYRPFLMDEESSLQNTSATAILMGMALAYDEGGKRTVRAMTSADSYSAFAGVAWETIRPGAYGRVKTKGWLPITDMLRGDGAGIAVGERFGIDPAQPGYIRAGRLDGTGILRVARPSLAAGLWTLEVGAGLDVPERLAIVQGARMPVTNGALPLQTDETGLASLIMTPDGLDGHFARPGSQRTPVTNGRRPVMIDQDGAMPFGIDENGRMILGPLASEPVVRMPVTGGIRPRRQTSDGEVQNADYDGVGYEPGAIARSVADPAGEVALGRKQVAVYDVAPGTMMATRRVISLSQQMDLEALAVVAPGMLRVKGLDPLYPIGVVTWRPLSTTALTPQFLDIIIKMGQSNAGGFDGDGLGGTTNSKFTLLPPLPGTCLTFNGGPHPHQTAGGSNDSGTPMTPDRYTSFIDMAVGEREGQGLGAAEAYALAMGQASKVLLINQSFSGTSFTNLVGASTGSDAQAWTDLRAMISAAVSLAAALGMTARIRGIIWNQGENNDADTVAQYMARLDIFGAKTDALKDLTGQTDPIPKILCQPASTKDLNSGLPQPAALAMGNWAAIAANNAVAVPLYWGTTNDVPTVHHLAQTHRHIDELTGNILWEAATYGRFRLPRVLSARRVGRKVTAIMSEPVTVDADGVTDPGNYGISYRDSTDARGVSGVQVDGNIITFLVSSTATGVGEVMSIGCHGAKVYSDVVTSTPNRNGIGRQYGLRSCIRSLRFFGSHTTGRPLFLWAQQQELSVTVSA